jgi:ligand-binding SRPBCC domain-containing protein
VAIAEYRSAIDAPAAELFAWHARPGAFERLVPPWDDVRVVERRGTIRDGDELRMQLRRGPLRLTWLARHEHYVEGWQFVDVQVRGPFRHWRHVHRCLAGEAGGSVLHDRIEYALPLAPVSHWIAGRRVRTLLDRMFAFRHARTTADLRLHQAHHVRPRLAVGVVDAGTGLGRDLAAFLATGGHAVRGVIRVGAALAAVDPFMPDARPERLPAFDALVVPESSRSPLTQSQRAFDLLAHFPTVPATLVTVAERPQRDSPLLHSAEATARARGVRLVVVHRPADDDWQTRDALVGLIHEALMRPGLAGPLALDHVARGPAAFPGR